jgi:predicted ATPase/DNA-binding SARP family transcriptional activator
MLGPLEVRTGPGEVLEVGGSRLRSLLILLALRPGQLVLTSELIDGLWGESAPGGAANALQALVSRLRRALPGAVIESRPAGYQLKLDPQATDIVRFEELAAAGRDAASADPAAAAATLRQALSLWRGPALPEVAETDFGRAVIARLDELRLSALEHRIDADLRSGRHGQLVAELEGLVVAHPMREPLAGLLMRALAASGRRGAALEVYEQTRERLVDLLGVEPSAELAALHLDLLRADDRPAASPAEPAPRPAAPTNLRAELTSFVGRDAELAQVAGLLGAHRLITLTGPGGAGKTRLAVEAARAELPAVPDGVWLVELAPVTDPAEVPSAVLGALGLREQFLVRTGKAAGTFRSATDDQADTLARLVGALARQQALLVLDNCEHLVAAAATLADRVLAACPRVRILATSREPLNITGEAVWTVGPLALPPEPAVTSMAAERAVVPVSAPAGRSADGNATAGSIATEDFASVRLLTQRARAVYPGFEVTGDNAAAVASICRALDGMPLAIELAAARLRTMSAEQIAARLDDRFQLLSSGSRTAMPRHQTLRAVVDWSWDLLDDAERALWRRFSVFTGGATLEAAEQVCSGPNLDGPDLDGIDLNGTDLNGRVLDLVTALADKSLLTVRHGPAGPRYRMLEIIRAYGQERLAEAGERDELRQAHARYFTALAETGQAHLRGAGQLDWLRRLSEDQDNLHAALRGAAGAGDGDTAVRLAAALGWYWSLRSMKIEGAELIADALSAVGDPAPPAESLAEAYIMGGLLAGETPMQATAVGWFERAAELADQIPPSAHSLLPLIGPLSQLFLASQRTQGQPPRPEIFDAAVAAPDPWVSAMARTMRAHTALNLGQQHAQAEDDFLAAARSLEALGDRWAQAVALGGLAMLAGWRGEHAVSVARYRQAHQFATELGSTEDQVHFRLFMVRELWLAGQRDAARAELAQALPEAERMGLPEVTAFAAYTAGDLARLEGEPETARAALTRALDLARGPDISQQIHAVAATALGYLAGAAGNLDEARELHAEALATARSAADAPVIAEALAGLADLALREGDPERSAELLGASLGIRGAMDRSAIEGQAVAEQARALLGDARYDAAYQRGQGATVDTQATLGPVTPRA